jgi:hypothetical protein
VCQRYRVKDNSKGFGLLLHQIFVQQLEGEPKVDWPGRRFLRSELETSPGELPANPRDCPSSPAHSGETLEALGAFSSITIGRIGRSSNLSSTAGALDAAAAGVIRVDASGGLFGYVYPTDLGKIYLGLNFFKAPASTGYDSKLGTLIHEMTHFWITGKTQQYERELRSM